MNLYLISQHVNDDYDTYDSAVVCAYTEDDARMIHPCYTEWDGEDEKDEKGYFTWCASKDVDVKFIGTADNVLPNGTVVCASFNAG